MNININKGIESETKPLGNPALYMVNPALCMGNGLDYAKQLLATEHEPRLHIVTSKGGDAYDRYMELVEAELQRRERESQRENALISSITFEKAKPVLAKNRFIGKFMNGKTYTKARKNKK